MMNLRNKSVETIKQASIPKWMSVFFIIFLLHFGYRCVLQVEGSIDDEIISDVTRLFDRRFHTASTEAESGFRTRDRGFGRGG